MKTVTAYLVVLAVCFLFGIGLMLTSPVAIKASDVPGCSDYCKIKRPGSDPLQECEPYGQCRAYWHYEYVNVICGEGSGSRRVSISSTEGEGAIPCGTMVSPMTSRWSPSSLSSGRGTGCTSPDSPTISRVTPGLIQMCTRSSSPG